MGKQCFVYIMTSQQNTALYTGITGNLKRRAREHKAGRGSSFTARFQIRKLVYFEVHDDVRSAIAREKQIKAGSRQKKIDLVNGMNPDWDDLYDGL